MAKKNGGKMFGFVLGSLLGGPIGAGVGTFLGACADGDIDETNGTNGTNEHNQTNQIEDLPYGSWVQALNGKLILECPHCSSCAGASAPGEHWTCNSCENSYVFPVTQPDLNHATEGHSRNLRLGLKCAMFIYGYLAKVDGRVSEEEVKMVSTIIDEWETNFDNREELIGAFHLGRDSEHDTEYKIFAKTFNNIFADDTESLFIFVADIIDIGFADGDFSNQERNIVEDIAINIIGVKAEFYVKMVNDIGNKNNSQNDQLTQAYITLGCEENSSLKDVKGEYRQLVLKYHPDTISGKDLPAEFTEFANQKFREVNEAFVVIETYLKQSQAA
jgi:DnaJ like chaperone protein